MTPKELLETYLKPTDLTVKELIDRDAFAQIMQFAEAYRLEQLRIGGVSQQRELLIDNTNDKVASEEEKAIWKILDEYGVNPMIQPHCSGDIIVLVNKLFIQRVSGADNYR